jgi:PKD repeat protein
VTCNSVSAVCGDAVAVTGASAIVAENNFLGTDPVSGCSGPTAALSVATQSAPGVHADYNALHATDPGVEYIWSGVSYKTAVAFAGGTGQGRHDLDVPGTVPTSDPPAAGSLLIDSADCGAPGELTTDLYGLPHVDDPLVPDTGTGSCHADRGAVELQDPIVVSFSHGGTSQGIVPFRITITITSKASRPWNELVSYSVDFGDGSAPESVSASGSVTHTYTVPGVYQLAVTGRDTGGSSATKGLRVVVGTVSPPSDGLTTGPDVFTAPKYSGISVVSGDFIITPGPDSWEVANTALDFGDGGSTVLGSLLSWSHMYPRPGTYTATLIVTDLFGRTSTTKATITVGNEFVPIGPYVDRGNTANDDFAIGPHSAIALSLAQLNAGFSNSAAAQLVVSVAKPGGMGSLTVYPDGSTRPAQADLDFARAQAASGVVLAIPGPDGKVAFYNNSSSTVTVAITTTGIEVTGNGTTGQDGDTYAPVGPTRVLDTRQPVHHPVGAGQKVTFSVAAAGVPASADQV